MSETVDFVKRMARGRWKAILIACGIEERVLTRYNHPCPACGGRDRFTFYDKTGDGDYFCRGCGPGDGLSLLMKYRRCSFPEALAFVEDFCGIPRQSVSRETSPGKGEETDRRQRMRRLMALWAEAEPIRAGDPVWAYLEGRGLNPALAELEVRCHKALRYVDKNGAVQGTYAAMLARLTDDKGNLLNLHRTYLEGGKKAPVESPKKAMDGGFKGAAVRFGTPKETLGLAEGIETALACRELFHIPVWASIGVANLAGFSAIPPWVKFIRIYADNDVNMAGQAGAYRLANTLSMRGLEAKVLVAPNPGTDWLDFLRGNR